MQNAFGLSTSYKEKKQTLLQMLILVFRLNTACARLRGRPLSVTDAHGLGLIAAKR